MVLKLNICTILKKGVVCVMALTHNFLFLVNPNTIARAYRELESAGVVASKRGAGVFVSDSGSPLSRKEKTRILHERIDALLTESSQLAVGVDSLLKLIEQRSKKFDSTRRGKS